MPAQPFSPAKPSLAFAKIVANPTETAWSQVYNAGSLFATLSLEQKGTNEEGTLPVVGKKIVSNLEAEFFTLEEKSLTAIKEAIHNSLQDIPETVTLSVCLAFFKDSLLYVFIFGAGKVLLRREGKIGTILHKNNDEPTLISASGYVQNTDTVLLQTNQFSKSISDADMQAALDLQLPSDIAEALTPHIHQKEEGGAAAVIISYQGITHSTPPLEQADEAEPSFEKEDLVIEPPVRPTKKRKLLPSLPAFPRLPAFPIASFLKLSHKKKILLSITVILIVLLIASIVLTKQKQQNAKYAAIFQQVFVPAKQNYDDGMALIKLNAGLAHDDFAKADQLIKANLSKFPEKSSERIQLQQLLDQVDSQLSGTPAATSLKPATVTDTDMLAVEKISDGTSFAQDEKRVYVLSQKAVTAVDKSNGKKGDIISNSQDWQDGAALAPYQGNIYVLDRKDGIVKYVAGSVGFEKTAYFKGTVPDLSNATALAIDSSVWILKQDGSILKYTRGQSDTYAVSGLDKPLSKPRKIFTDASTESVYVLDSGNSRIVKFGKDGTFQAQYPASQIKDAKDFEIDEANKKILFLSEGNIWELSL